MVRRIYRWMISLSGAVALVGMVLITVFTGYEVIMRQIFGRPTIWTNEVTGYLLIWVGMLGVVYAYDKAAHVSVDLVYRFLPRRFRAVLDVITTTLILLFAICICYYGYQYWWMGYVRGWRHFGMLDVPMSYTRAAFPLIGAMLVFQVALDLCDRIADLMKIHEDALSEDGKIRGADPTD